MLEFVIRYVSTGNVQPVNLLEISLLLRWNIPVKVLSHSIINRPLLEA